MKQPSLAKNKIIQDTHTYLNTNVDPIMSGAITYMLIERPPPENMLQILLTYLTQLNAGVTLTPRAPPTKTPSTARLYMAKQMSPVFTHLMNLVLALRPEDVKGYLVTALAAMIER